MKTTVKICGLSSPDHVDIAVKAGADMVGLVFFDASPRNVTCEAGAALAEHARGRARIVALSVDADDDRLAAIVAALHPDLLQLHGRETPERVAAIRDRFGVPCMKAIGVADASDLARVAEYRAVCERVLLDGKPPREANRPGGLGAAFDWTILAGFDFGPAWMLSGGLDANNVTAALAATGAPGVDVSSGVESAPGEKDTGLIEAFVAAVRAHDAGKAAAA
jgi:phosphoribosylanthranilate isomerase